MSETGTSHLHLYVLLDRSGSMASMATDVIGGFNHLVAEQQADGPDARITLVQFDGQDPQETVAEAVPLLEVAPLTAETFVPRGATPLLDATGLLLGRAVDRAAQLAANGEQPEAVVFATITDGFENASREFTLAAVNAMVEKQKAADWSFVYIGADPSSYHEAGGIGVDARSTKGFAASPSGAQDAFSTLSRATAERRRKIRANEDYDAQDFFEGDKGAEPGTTDGPGRGRGPGRPKR